MAETVRNILLPTSPCLRVTEADDAFECCVNGATGWPIVGRGMSVAEAVGDWAINAQNVRVFCDPPNLLEKYRVSECLTHQPIPQRGDVVREDAGCIFTELIPENANVGTFAGIHIKTQDYQIVVASSRVWHRICNSSDVFSPSPSETPRTFYGRPLEIHWKNQAAKERANQLMLLGRRVLLLLDDEEDSSNG